MKNTYNKIVMVLCTVKSGMQNLANGGKPGFQAAIRLLRAFALFFSLSLFFITVAFGVPKTFTGGAGFTFGDATKWNGGTLPAAGDNLTINGICVVDNNVLTDNIAYGTIVIGGTSAGTFSWAAGGTNRLNVSIVSSSFAGSSLNMTNGGTLIIRGTWASANLAFTPGTGTIDIRSSITLPAAYSTYRNLIINGAATTVSLGTATTVNGNVTVTSGTFTIGPLGLTIAGTTTVTSALTITSGSGSKTFGNVIINGTFTIGTANIDVTGNWTNNGTFNQGTGDVYFIGTTSQTLNGNFYNLRIDNGTGGSCTLGGNITVINHLYLATGILNAGSYTVTIANNILTNGVNLNAQTGTFIFNGTNAQTIDAGTTFNNVIVNGTGCTLQPQGNLTINGDLTVIDGTFDETTTTRIITGNGAGNTLNVQAGGTLKIRSGGTTPFASGYPGWESLIMDPGSTIELAGTNKTLDLTSMSNVLISAGVNTLGGNTTITGDLTFTGGSLTTSASNFSLIVTGNFSLGSSTLTANASTISVGGNFSGSGSLTAGTGTFVFNGTGSQTFCSTSQIGNYYNITINKASGSASPFGNVTLLNNLSISSGILDLGSFTSNRSVAGGTLTVSNGATLKIGGVNTLPANYSTNTLEAASTVEYNGTAQTVSAKSYGHLTLSGSGTKTMPVLAMMIAGNFTMMGTASATAVNSMTIGGDVILNSGGTFNAGPLTHNVAGNWTNNGEIFTPSASSIVFNGTGAQSINGTAASQTFNNITVSKSAGTLLSVNGSTTTLIANDFTVTTGNFTAPATMNLIAAAASSLTLNGGIFAAGTTINITGNWTNNGGTFTPGLNTVVFNGNGAQAITGTSASHTFYNVTIAKTAGTTLNTSGSTTTLTVQDFIETTGNFTAPAILNINGNRTLTAGVFTAGATTNVTGNWTTSGGTFTPGTGTVTFNGTTAQSITGATTFNNFTLNNSKAANAVTLSNSITVNGTFTLSDGHLITTASNILTLGAAATVTLNGIPQDSSFVKGPMIHTVATTTGITKTFPVGTGAIMHRADLTVTHSAATSTQYTGEYFPNSAIAVGYTLPGTLTKVSDISYWTISKGAGAAVAAASVKLYYFASDAVSDAPNLRIAKDDGAGAWTDIGGTGSAVPAGTITSTNNFTSFSKFTLGNSTGGSNVLPIELLFFDAQLNESVVDITWATASELNSDSFRVERSGDGFNFAAIVNVAAAGYSNQLIHYSSTDEIPLPGLSYYRLKQTDFDGTGTYSNIASVYTGSSADQLIYPNPVIGTTINVRLPDASVNVIQAIIHNMNGQEIFSKKVAATSDGTFTITIDAAEKLSSGIYLLSLISTNGSYQEKLIVQ